jgi:hypothetical protein
MAKKYDWDAIRNSDAYKNLGEITWSANKQMAEKVTMAAYDQRKADEAAQARKQSSAWIQAAKDKSMNQISGVDNEYTKLFGSDDPNKYTKWNTGKTNTKPMTGFEKFSNQLFGVIGGIKNLKKAKKVWVTKGDDMRDSVSGELIKSVWDGAMEIDVIAEDKNFYFARGESGHITSFRKSNCTEKKPTVESLNKAYKKAYEENGKKKATTLDKFAYNVSQGVQSVAYGTKEKGFEKTGSKALDVVSDIGGELLGFAAPSGLGARFAGGKLVGGSFSEPFSGLSEKAAEKGSQILGKYGGKVGAAIANKTIKGAGKAATIGALDMGQISFMKQEAPTAKEVAVNMTIGGVTGGVLSKTFEVIGNKIGKLRASRQAALDEHIIPDEKVTSEIVKKKPSISKSKYESALDFHNAKYDEYKSAETAWEDAVHEIQNKFGQSELTGSEQKAIKSEMGLDIEKLADNYDNAYNDYLKAKDALSKSIDRKTIASKKSTGITEPEGDLNLANKSSNKVSKVTTGTEEITKAKFGDQEINVNSSSVPKIQQLQKELQSAKKSANFAKMQGIKNQLAKELKVDSKSPSKYFIDLQLFADRRLSDMPNVNKKIQNMELSTETQHMTDTKGRDSLKNKILKAKDAFNRLVTDRYSDVSKISKEANELLNLESQSNGTIDYIANKSLVDRNGNPLANKSYSDVLKMPDEKLQKQYDDYLLNKHNIDRFNKKKTLLVDDAGNKITAERSKEIIANYEQAYPEFKELSKQYNAVRETFNDEWLSDFVSKDLRKYLKKEYPNYVPSHRQLESFNTKIPTNRIVAGASIKTATGSSKKIIPLGEQIFENMSKIVKANRRNEAYKEMLKPVLNEPEAFKDVIEVVKIGKNEYSNATEREIAKQVLNMRDDIIKGEDAINSIVDIINNPIKQVPGRDGYLTVFEKGTPITVKIKDKNLFNALNKSVKSDELTGLVKAWDKVVLTPFKGAITQYNPFFATRNVARDTPTAFVQGSENNPVKFIEQRFKAMYDIVKNDPAWKQYEAVGGRMTSLSSNPLKPVKMTGKAGKALTKLPRKYADALEVGEQFNRFAEFKKVLKETGDVNKARIAAANVTVNFGKGGTLLKMIDKVIPYSNAAVQGLTKSISTFKNKPLQSAAKAIVSSTIPAALFYAYNNSDKGRQKIYDEIPNDVKNSNLVMVVDKDTIIKIPKDFQAGLIFGSLGERLYDYFAKNDKEAFQGMPDTILKNFMPVDIKSGVVMPAINMAMGGNKDYFGREIIPRTMENVSPGQQYDEKTTWLAKTLGSQFNLSPKKIDYLLDSYAGVVYDLMKKSGENKGKGVIGKAVGGIADTAKANFTVNTDYTRSTNKYYEITDKIKQQKADFDQSIAGIKEQIKSQGISLSSKAGQERLNSLLGPKNAQKYADLKAATKKVDDQFAELRGSSSKDKKNKVNSFLRDLEKLYK